MTSLGKATDLSHLMISDSVDMERVFSAWCPSTGVLSSLARIHINQWHKLRELFSFGCLPRPPNLEEIDVHNCPEMEEIVTWEEGSRIISGSSDTTQTQLLCLPKLKILQLRYLPQLKSVFPENRITMASNALEKIEVENCPLLRTVPLHLPLLPDDQPSTPPYLQQVLIRPLKWWHSSDWGHANAKAVLRPFLSFAGPRVGKFGLLGRIFLMLQWPLRLLGRCDVMLHLILK